MAAAIADWNKVARGVSEREATILDLCNEQRANRAEIEGLRDRIGILGATIQMKGDMEDMEEKHIGDLAELQTQLTDLRRQLERARADTDKFRCQSIAEIPAGLDLHNACTDACDVVNGPCACGAWHSIDDVLAAAERKVRALIYQLKQAKAGERVALGRAEVAELDNERLRGIADKLATRIISEIDAFQDIMGWQPGESRNLLVIKMREKVKGLFGEAARQEADPT